MTAMTTTTDTTATRLRDAARVLRELGYGCRRAAGGGPGRFIATMHPGVALALAAVFDGLAGDVEQGVFVVDDPTVRDAARLGDLILADA